MRARIKTLNQSLDRLEQQDAYFGLTTEEYWCGSKDSYLGLTCTEYWCVDFYWSLLHWLPEEVEEREQLEARDDALWGMYYEARKKNGPYAGWPDEKNNKAELLRIGKRSSRALKKH